MKEQTLSIIEKAHSHLTSEEVKAAVQIKSEILFQFQKYLRDQNFVEILPTILSPITDPLNHKVFDSEISVYGESFHLTQSMIFHKQIAMHSFDRIFISSPNVRLEEPLKNELGKYLFEFLQVDLEMKNAKREDVMRLVERMIISTFKTIKTKMKKQLDFFGRNLHIPVAPFERIKYYDALKKYGPDFESILSKKKKEPFWLIDIPIHEREFYDKLSDDGKTLLDMDLILPEGYGEVSSGGEREHELERIFMRMELKGNSKEDFSHYIEMVEKFGLYPSAGCGIGIERLTRFVCGLPHVKYTRLFPKVPGEFSL